jgi:hypothetical protein
MTVDHLNLSDGENPQKQVQAVIRAEIGRQHGRVTAVKPFTSGRLISFQMWTGCKGRAALAKHKSLDGGRVSSGSGRAFSAIDSGW